MATGGDPRGTWLPLQVCFKRSIEMLQTAGDPCPPILLEEETTKHVTEMTIRDGFCDVALTGMTVVETRTIPNECQVGPPLELCLAEEDFQQLPLPGYYGETVSAVCALDEEENWCRCDFRYEWFSEKGGGTIHCDIRPTSIAQYKDGPIEYEHSVEGDYLIRRLIRYPQSMPPKEDGTPRQKYDGFEIYRRAE